MVTREVKEIERLNANILHMQKVINEKNIKLEALEGRAQELERFIQDARAFIEWAFLHNSEALIRSTLIHDIAGLADRAECFSPRVSGYAKRQEISKQGGVK
jgi:hypothetical protein